MTALLVRVPQRAEDPPALLYHYTTRPALIGMISSKAVWATHIRYLNDAAEYSYAADFASDLIRFRRETHKSPEEILYLDELQRRLAAMDVNTETYVFSLSADGGDRLSQWRAYTSPGDSYSLGFRSDALVEIADRDKLFFLKCIYNRDEQQRQLLALLDRSLDALGARLPERDPAEHREGVVISTLVEFDLLAATLKDPAFAEEQEWRLILSTRFAPPCPILFRPGKSLVTPYVVMRLTLDDGAFPIRQVVLGPSPHMPLDAYAVLRLCAAHGVRVSELLHSVVPYRAW